MAGELVDLKIRAHMAKHKVGYVQAYNEVLADGGPEVEAYERGEPGLRERVRTLRSSSRNSPARFWLREGDLPA
jgi:hypothetical protein